ncbi:MAG: amidohydrolase family protein [Planctomycetota bacterium]
MGATLLKARWVFATARARFERGGVLLSGGRIVRVLENESATARCARSGGVRVLDLRDCVLAPGFVDAHVHLDLTALEGRLEGRGTFAAWIKALVRERSRISKRALKEAVLRGADRLISSGTTCVGDIDSSGVAEVALRTHPLRAVIYREALDAGRSERAAGALARASRPFARSARVSPGISPHAPYTVSRELLASLAALSKRRRWPASIHWAETREEVDWLARGAGPFRALLRGSRSPRTSGLDAIEASGLLGPGLTLVHGNHPSPGDLSRIARAGAVLVHCPGTHLYFGREPFPLRRWLEAGVTVALGTDGLSSNAELDMRREMSLLRQADPGLRPEVALDLATRAGARALGLAGRAGEIVPGAFADLCAHRFPGSPASGRRGSGELLDALTSGRSSVAGVWIGGRPVVPPREFRRQTSESRRANAE